MGSYEMTSEMVVADIDDNSLLGYDILKGGAQDPADLLLSEEVIELDGVNILCFQEGKRKGFRRVTVTDDVLVPNRAEVLVDVLIEREETDDHDKHAEYIVESSVTFTQNYQLVMAASLIDINRPTCQKICCCIKTLT